MADLSSYYQRDYQNLKGFSSERFPRNHVKFSVLLKPLQWMDMRGSFYDNTDPVAIGSEVANRASEYINQGMEARSAQEQNKDSSAIFQDIHYKKIVKDPIGTVEKIYNGFGLSLSDEAAERMRRYLDENPQHKYGAHRYTIEQFGLNENTERERFSTYCEHFGIT